MRLIYGNLFDPTTYRFVDGRPVPIKPSAIVITTNGFVKKTGDAVMGRGCAKAATDIDPRLPLALGKAIKANGNRVQIIGTHLGMHPIVSFPVKPSLAICTENKSNVVKHMQGRMTVNKRVPGWACIADLKLITRSARQLVELSNKKEWASVVIPRPGCGAGELDWDIVKPVLDSILDDMFYSITFGGIHR